MHSKWILAINQFQIQIYLILTKVLLYPLVPIFCLSLSSNPVKIQSMHSASIPFSLVKTTYPISMKVKKPTSTYFPCRINNSLEAWKKDLKSLSNQRSFYWLKNKRRQSTNLCQSRKIRLTGDPSTTWMIMSLDIKTGIKQRYLPFSPPIHYQLKRLVCDGTDWRLCEETGRNFCRFDWGRIGKEDETHLGW